MPEKALSLMLVFITGFSVGITVFAIYIGKAGGRKRHGRSVFASTGSRKKIRNVVIFSEISWQVRLLGMTLKVIVKDFNWLLSRLFNEFVKEILMFMTRTSLKLFIIRQLLKKLLVVKHYFFMIFPVLGKLKV
jgi:hypothetical protein